VTGAFVAAGLAAGLAAAVVFFGAIIRV